MPVAKKIANNKTGPERPVMTTLRVRLVATVALVVAIAATTV